MLRQAVSLGGPSCSETELSAGIKGIPTPFAKRYSILTVAFTALDIARKILLTPFGTKHFLPPEFNDWGPSVSEGCGPLQRESGRKPRGNGDGMYTQQAKKLGSYSSSLGGLREGHDGVRSGPQRPCRRYTTL